MQFGLRCLVFGHDDRIRRVPGRMYLECAECGRATDGWDISPQGQPFTSPRRFGPMLVNHTWRASWRELWSEIARSGFQIDALRRIIQ